MLLNIEQRTQSWYDWRNGLDLPDKKPRMTATAVATMLGNSPWQTASQLFEEMVGLRPPKKVTPAMQAGIDFEDEARFALQEHLGIEFMPICAQMDGHPENGASLDGITEDFDHIAEIKVPGAKTLNLAQLGMVPPNYVDQMQWQLACVGPEAAKVSYWAYDRVKKVGHLVTVWRDDLRIAELIAAAARFRECVVLGTPPGGFELELQGSIVALSLIHI